MEPPEVAITEKLKELKKLYEDGLLTNHLYEQKANALLSKIGFEV